MSKPILPSKKRDHSIWFAPATCITLGVGNVGFVTILKDLARVSCNQSFLSFDCFGVTLAHLIALTSGCVLLFCMRKQERRAFWGFLYNISGRAGFMLLVLSGALSWLTYTVFRAIAHGCPSGQWMLTYYEILRPPSYAVVFECSSHAVGSLFLGLQAITFSLLFVWWLIQQLNIIFNTLQTGKDLYECPH